MQKVEDIYLPYKQKRRTKATIAKEAGLMPMAQFIQTFPESGIEDKAQTFINHEQGIESVEDVLAGVHEIFAEVVGENAGLREWVRNYTQKNGQLTSKIKRGAQDKDPQKVYELYYDFSTPLPQVLNHQELAIHRGEKRRRTITRNRCGCRCNYALFEV